MTRPTRDSPAAPTTPRRGVTREAIRSLAERGHRVIGHVGGAMSFAYTQLRKEDAEAAARGTRLLHA